MRWLSGSSASLVFLLSTTLANADRVFYAESVSYCSTARAIEVSKFLLEYDADSNSISFDISAATTQTNLDALLEFSLTAYGINAVNQTINLCDELSGVLCPLPTYDFVGSATLPLPASVTSSINIPGIGYKIPDLQATAVVRLINQRTRAEAACLKVDLSNGKSMRWQGVAWALGGLALGSLLVGFLGGLVAVWRRNGEGVELGRSKERLVSLITFFQFVATTGLLSLDYPQVLTAFTANFAWSLGLIYVTPIQMGIDTFRNHTGGNLTQVAGNLVGGTAALTPSPVRRSLPPASYQETTDLIQSDLTTIFERLVLSYAEKAVNLAKRATTMSSEITVPTVQQNDTLNTVDTGIPRYVTSLDISPFSAFMTVFITFLLFICIFLAVLLVVTPPFYFFNSRAEKRDGHVRLTRKVFWNLVRANALRLLIVSWFPIILFSFFQWSIGKHESWGAAVLAAFTCVFTTVAFLILAITTFLKVHRSHHIEFNEKEEPLHAKLIASGAGSSAPYWNGFKESRWWFFVPLLLATFVRACFISFAQNHGWRQSVGLLVVEVLIFLAMCIFTPFADKSSNGTNITIQILKIIISGALIAFNRSIGLNQIVAVALGLVIAVIESVIVVGYFFLIVIDAVSIFISIFRRPRRTSGALDGFATAAEDMQEVGRSRRSGSMTLADPSEAEESTFAEGRPKEQREKEAGQVV